MMMMATPSITVVGSVSINGDNRKEEHLLPFKLIKLGAIGLLGYCTRAYQLPVLVTGATLARETSYPFDRFGRLGKRIRTITCSSIQFSVSGLVIGLIRYCTDHSI